MNNEEFKKIQCTIGNRWTTGYDTSTGKQKPSKDGKVYATVNSNLYEIIEEYLLKDDYRRSCQEKADYYNKTNELSITDPRWRKAKFYAKSIYPFTDYRFTKYDTVTVDGINTKVLTNKSFLEHTGLMGFDIDFPKGDFDDEKLKWLKEGLFEKLKQFEWMCMITLSTGGKGIHIYTYNDVPDNYSKEDSVNSKRIAYFNSCYQYKSYFIYRALYDLFNENEVRNDFEYIFSLLDFAMYKPEQTLNITVYDNDPLINENFKCGVCNKVIENIEKGYDNWIHREGVSLKPDAEVGYSIFNEYYCNIGKFLGEDKYSITKGAVYEKTKQPKPKKKESGGPFYFGHNERHNGIPTLHEICRYLLATRNYDEAKRICSDPDFYQDGYSPASECTNNILRLLDWYNSRDVEYIPSEYVNEWLNSHAGFNDTLVWNEIDQSLVSYFSHFVKDAKGRIDNTAIDNYIFYLNTYPLYKNNLKWNEFSRQQELWSKKFCDGESVDYAMKDIDRTLIRNNFNRHLKFLSKNLIEDAVSQVCAEHKYNPIIEYLDSLEWDGVPRVETMLHDWLGAEDIPLYRQYCKLWMYAAVKRAYEPGCKWDNILVCVGKQGDGKTEFFKRLGKEWNTSNKFDVSNKDYINKLNKAWIVIMDELAGLDKKEMDVIKNFFSNQDDDDRLAYARDNEKFKRHCIFVATSNKKEFLRDIDDMYERRFWCVPIQAKSQTYVFDNFKEKDVANLWAEAVAMYKADKEMSLYLGVEYIDLAKKDQVKFKAFNVDDKVGLISDIFNKEYVFPVTQKMYHGNYVFESYDDFLSYQDDRKKIEPDGVKFISSRCDIFPVNYLKRYMNDIYHENFSCKYISFATGFDYKQVKIYNNKCFVRVNEVEG